MVRIPALVLLLLAAFLPAPVAAQPVPPPAPVFSPPELDQMLAPIALYPDALLAQVLTAATYPLDVVAADRWVQQPVNARLRGAALAVALEQQPWDPSVKSLVPFPQVLRMMDTHLAWMQRLGDAFLAQPEDVMASVQRLREEARAAGTLVSTPQQTVEVVDGTIVIVPANPAIVYVPYYNPVVVYGGWRYPAYPPFYLRPPSGFAVSGFFFNLGITVVAPLWGWGDFDWHRHYIRIDRERFNRINRGRPPVTTNVWRFDPSRRGAVPYRDARSREQYQRPLPGPPPATREQFRGYAAPPAARRAPTPQARPPISRPPQPQVSRPQAQPRVSRPAAPPQGARPTVPTQRAARPPAAQAPRPQVARPTTPRVTRPAAPPSAFQPAPRGPAAVRTEAQRGARSRAAPVAVPRAAPAPQRAAPSPQRRGPSGGGAPPQGRPSQPQGERGPHR